MQLLILWYSVKVIESFYMQSLKFSDIIQQCFFFDNFDAAVINISNVSVAMFLMLYCVNNSVDNLMFYNWYFKGVNWWYSFIIFWPYYVESSFLVWSTKLSNVDLDQCLNGWPPGNIRCCKLGSAVAVTG